MQQGRLLSFLLSKLVLAVLASATSQEKQIKCIRTEKEKLTLIFTDEIEYGIYFYLFI